MASEIVGVVFNIAKLIYAQAVLAKKNQRFCRRLSDEVKALEPILTDIQTRWDSFPDTAQTMMCSALELLKTDFQRALDYVDLQTKTHSLKKFIMAGSAEEEFEEISVRIRDSKSTFMLAMVNKIDQSTSMNHDSIKRSERAIKMEEMKKAFDAKEFDLVIETGRAVLKLSKDNKGESVMVIYLSIACAYSCKSSPDDAMTYLHMAKENGFDDLAYLECEELMLLKSYPDFVTFKTQLIEEVKIKERWRSLPERQIDELTKNFEKFDVDASGTIDATEFRVLLKNATKAEFSEEQVKQILTDIDNDGSGEISLNEYLNWMSDHKHDMSNYLASTIRPKKNGTMGSQELSQQQMQAPLLYHPLIPMGMPMGYGSPPMMMHQNSMMQMSPMMQQPMMQQPMMQQPMMQQPMMMQQSPPMMHQQMSPQPMQMQNSPAPISITISTNSVGSSADSVGKPEKEEKPKLNPRRIYYGQVGTNCPFCLKGKITRKINGNIAALLCLFTGIGGIIYCASAKGRGRCGRCGKMFTRTQGKEKEDTAGGSYEARLDKILAADKKKAEKEEARRNKKNKK